MVNTTGSETELRIIVIRQPGGWVAYFRHDPTNLYADPTVSGVIGLLLAANAELGVLSDNLVLVKEECNADRIEFAETCPHCRGNGAYVGFNLRAQCGPCGGIGVRLL